MNDSTAIRDRTSECLSNALRIFILIFGRTTALKGTQEPAAGGKSVVKGTGEFVRGTGRFEGVKGTYTFTGSGMTPYGKETKSQTCYDSVGTYTFPEK